jgi:hypothetical protein
MPSDTSISLVGDSLIKSPPSPLPYSQNDKQADYAPNKTSFSSSPFPFKNKSLGLILCPNQSMHKTHFTSNFYDNSTATNTSSSQRVLDLARDGVVHGSKLLHHPPNNHHHVKSQSCDTQNEQPINTPPVNFTNEPPPTFQ